jgi:hypothetical protein
VVILNILYNFMNIIFLEFDDVQSVTFESGVIIFVMELFSGLPN